MKIDPDHRPSEARQFTKREYEDGGWVNFEQWAGVSWFGGINPPKEKYGTIRNDKKIPSRFPIHDKVEGKINEQLAKSAKRYPDCDE